MTRKHFQAIADVLKDTAADVLMCTTFATMCQRENSRFDCSRFLTACGLESVDGMWVRS